MRPFSLPTFRLVCLTTGLSLLAGLSAAQVGERNAHMTTPTPAARVDVIDFRDNLLTVRVRDASLKEVLAEVTRQSGVTLQGQDSITDRIAIQLDRLPLEEALHHLLRGQSYLVVSREPQREDKSTRSRFPQGVRVFRRTGARSSSQIPRVAGKTREDEARKMDPEIARLFAVLEQSDDAWEQEDALLALVRSGEPDVALPLSRLALTNTDTAVRVAAIQALVKVGGDQAAQGLAIALQDENAHIRQRAVEALGPVGGERAMFLLGYVWTRDPDESVRDNAAATLAQLEEPVR